MSRVLEMARYEALAARLPRFAILFAMVALAVVKIHALVTMGGRPFYFHPYFLWTTASLELVIGCAMASRYWRFGAHATWMLAVAGMAVAGERDIGGFEMQYCGCFGALQVSTRMHIGVCAGMFCTAVAALLMKERSVDRIA